jgi:hypothetical protein
MAFVTRFTIPATHTLTGRRATKTLMPIRYAGPTRRYRKKPGRIVFMTWRNKECCLILLFVLVLFAMGYFLEYVKEHEYECKEAGRTKRYVKERGRHVFKPWKENSDSVLLGDAAVKT